MVYKNKVPQGKSLYLIKGQEYGVPTWYYVQVDNFKKSKLSRLRAAKNTNLKELGEIVFSGYGDYPPDYVREEIEKLPA